MTKVAVSREVLDWALKRSDALADAERKFPKLQEWRRGESEPTLRQVELLAKATSTPFGYFFLDKPPDDVLPFPHFRTLGDKAVSNVSPDLLETVHSMERRQSWMREYVIKLGQDRLSFVGSANVDGNIGATADAIRKTLGLAKGWAATLPNWTAALAELRSKIEAARILVFSNGILGNNTSRKLNPAEFRGLVMVDDYAPLVFINTADGKAAQMFTLAHELAHVWVGKSAAFDLQGLEPAENQTEQICNQVAAEFLLPENELRAIWPSVRSGTAPFDAIARQFKISQLVAARRALDLALINKAQFFKFYNAYMALELKASSQGSGGDFYASQNMRVGKRFGAAVVRAAKEGSLLYRDAYQLTGLYGKTFDEFANNFGANV